jgi:hypothetical protein
MVCSPLRGLEEVDAFACSEVAVITTAGRRAAAAMQRCRSETGGETEKEALLAQWLKCRIGRA